MILLQREYMIIKYTEYKNVQEYLILLCFVLLCYTDIAGVFYKWEARPSNQQKD